MRAPNSTPIAATGGREGGRGGTRRIAVREAAEGVCAVTTRVPAEVVHGLEALGRKLQQQARLAHGSVPDDDVLEQVAERRRAGCEERVLKVSQIEYEQKKLARGDQKARR